MMDRRLFPLLLSALFLLSACTPPVSETGANIILEEKNLQYVALTFDDGPRADTTALLLDGLRQRDARATFFVIGQQIPGNEDLIRRMADEGHQVGNHTYSHTRLREAGDNTIIEEIQKTEVLLTEILGEGSYWLRPPYGLVDYDRTALMETPMIYWSLDPEDWKLLDTDKVVDAVLSQVQSGDIVLLHDFYRTSVDAALQIVDALQAEGYAFVTVEDLFDLCQVEPQNGVLYATPTRERVW